MDNYPWSNLHCLTGRRGSVLVRIFEGEQPRSQGFHLQNTGRKSPADEFGSRDKLMYTISNKFITYLG